MRSHKLNMSMGEDKVVTPQHLAKLIQEYYSWCEAADQVILDHQILLQREPNAGHSEDSDDLTCQGFSLKGQRIVGVMSRTIEPSLLGFSYILGQIKA